MSIATNLNAAAKDDQIEAVIITGKGRYFTAGTDLKDAMAQLRSGVRRNSWEAPVGRFVHAVITFPKVFYDHPSLIRSSLSQQSMAMRWELA